MSDWCDCSGDAPEAEVYGLNILSHTDNVVDGDEKRRSLHKIKDTCLCHRLCVRLRTSGCLSSYGLHVTANSRQTSQHRDRLNKVFRWSFLNLVRVVKIMCSGEKSVRKARYK